MFLTKTRRSPFYQIIYFKDGKQTSKSTRTESIEEAEIILKAFKSSIIELPEITPDCSSLRLNKFAKEYIDLISITRSEAYLSRSVKPAFKYLILNFGDANLESINSKNAELFLLSCYKKSKYNALLYHRVLKAAFTKAIKWEYLEKNPFIGFKLPKIQRKPTLFITFEELKMIIEKTEKQVFKDLFQFAFFTGMRLSEITNLKWIQVDLKREVIQVGSDEFQTKSRRIRTIPMARQVKDILVRLKPVISQANNWYVFNKGCGIGFNADYVSRNFKTAVRNAEISDNIHFHSLRISFGSYLFQNGVSISVISKLLGHSSLLVTERHYTSLTFTNLIEAMQSLNEKK